MESKFLATLREKRRTETENFRNDSRIASTNSKRNDFEILLNRTESPNIEKFKKICEHFSKDKKPKDLEKIVLGLLSGTQFCKHFLSTKGAPHGLFWSLSGSKPRSQVSALIALINLSYYINEEDCLYLANKTGSYVLSLIGGEDPHIKSLCYWYMGNLCFNSIDGSTLLKSQGFETTIPTVISSSAHMQIFQWGLFAIMQYLNSRSDRIRYICDSSFLNVLSFYFSTTIKKFSKICNAESEVTEHAKNITKLVSKNSLQAMQPVKIKFEQQIKENMLDENLFHPIKSDENAQSDMEKKNSLKYLSWILFMSSTDSVTCALLKEKEIISTAVDSLLLFSNSNSFDVTICTAFIRILCNFIFEFPDLTVKICDRSIEFVAIVENLMSCHHHHLRIVVQQLVANLINTLSKNPTGRKILEETGLKAKLQPVLSKSFLKTQIPENFSSLTIS